MRPSAVRHDRLVLGTQLAAAERAAQIAIQRGAVIGDALLTEVDRRVPGAAFALRLVHRGVGDLQHLLRRRCCPRPANAMPTLALTWTSTSVRKNVSASAAPIRAASGPPCDVSSRSSHRITNSSPPSRASVSPARSMAAQSIGDGDEQLVADVVPVRVVDRFELVEIGEQDRDDLSGALAAHDRVIETLHEQRAVRQSGQRVVQRALARTLGRLAEVGAGLRVEEVGGGDVGQRLRGHHRAGVQRAGNVAVHVERAELAVRPGAAGT